MLDSTMGELEELVLANRRVTDALVADMEARLELLEEELEQEVVEGEEGASMMKVKNDAFKELESVQLAKLEEMNIKLRNEGRKVEALEGFQDALMKTLLTPNVVEALDTMKRQENKIIDLDRKLKDVEEKINKSVMNRSGNNTTKDSEDVPKLKLRGLKISVSRAVNQHKEIDLKMQKKQNVSTPAPKLIENVLKSEVMNTKNIVAKQDVSMEQNHLEIVESDVGYWDEMCEVRKELENVHEDLETTKEYVHIVDDKEDTENYDVKDEQFNPFWFCGPPSEDVKIAQVVEPKVNNSKSMEMSVDQSKVVRPNVDESKVIGPNVDKMWKVEEGDGPRNVDKMWKVEEGDDCGDCSNNWVHQCLLDT